MPLPATKLVRPRLGETRQLAKRFSRLLVEDDWYYRDANGGERHEIFSRWATTVNPPAIILPITIDMQVIAIRQFRNGADNFVIECPGGPHDDNECFNEGAIRELRAETGYEAEKIITLAPRVWIDPASLRTPFIPRLALNCRKVAEPRPEKTEILEVISVPLEEWFAMIRSGEVCDSKTVTTSKLAEEPLGIRTVFPPFP